MHSTTSATRRRLPIKQYHRLRKQKSNRYTININRRHVTHQSKTFKPLIRRVNKKSVYYHLKMDGKSKRIKLTLPQATEQYYKEFITPWWTLDEIPPFTKPWTALQAALWDYSNQFKVWQWRFAQPPGRLQCGATCCHIQLRQFTANLRNACDHSNVSKTVNPVKNQNLRNQNVKNQNQNVKIQKVSQLKNQKVNRFKINPVKKLKSVIIRPV